MSLPDPVPVRITSEGAESIGLSAVVAQQMPLDELLNYILGVTGKDPVRIEEILARGSFIAGGSRFRWQGVAPEGSELRDRLSRFPDPEPERPFRKDQCIRAVLRGGPRTLTIDRSAGAKKRWFRTNTFWDELLTVCVDPEYVTWSYREKADLYRSTLTPEALARLQNSAGLLAFSSLDRQVRSNMWKTVELFVTR